MTDVKKNKIGRPRKFHTKEQKKEYLKLRSREYYSSPEAKEKQRLKNPMKKSLPISFF